MEDGSEEGRKREREGGREGGRKGAVRADSLPSYERSSRINETKDSLMALIVSGF